MLSPRAYDLIAEAYDQIGNYVLVKNDRTGTYRTEMVTKTGVTMTKDGVSIDLITQNGFLKNLTPTRRSSTHAKKQRRQQ